MDLYTLCTFFGMRLAFFFICVSINLRYTQTVCADNGIILTAYSVNFNSCCYIDNVIFLVGSNNRRVFSSCNSSWFTKLSYYLLGKNPIIHVQALNVLMKICASCKCLLEAELCENSVGLQPLCC